MTNDKTTAATETELKELHGSVARTYLRAIQAYEAGEVFDKNGAVKACPASLLAAAARFLSDNGVDRPEREVDLSDPLADELPGLDDARYS